MLDAKKGDYQTVMFSREVIKIYATRNHEK